MTRGLAAIVLLTGGVLHAAACAPPSPGARPSAIPSLPLPAPALPGVITTAQLAELTGRDAATVIDARPDLGAYLRSHVPGAAHLNTESLRASQGGVPNLLLPAASYRILFSRLGVRIDRYVVVYSAGDARNFDATYVAWILAALGHPSVRVLDGGFAKWELEGRATTRTYPRGPTSDLASRGWAPERATLDDVRAALGQREMVLVDARVPEQYSGTAGPQMRRGHIPGAVSHYWQGDLTSDALTRVWRPVDELRAAYVAQGITADRDIIVYCNGGLESSHVHFALRYLLGYPRVRVYDGSFTEWAERTELPVETGGRQG
jgi:thiosulfate/3-mercaptopyruvate sulfurtransferase